MAKLYITLAILCIFGAAFVKGFNKEEAIAKFMAQAESCKNDVGATTSDMEEMLGKKPASTKEGKCLRACIMKSFGLMDSNGKADKAVAVLFAEKYTDGAADKMKIANEIIDACYSMAVSEDHCEAAEQYCTCFKEQAEAHGIADEFKL